MTQFDNWRRIARDSDHAGDLAEALTEALDALDVAERRLLARTAELSDAVGFTKPSDWDSCITGVQILWNESDRCLATYGEQTMATRLAEAERRAAEAEGDAALIREQHDARTEQRRIGAEDVLDREAYDRAVDRCVAVSRAIDVRGAALASGSGVNGGGKGGGET